MGGSLDIMVIGGTRFFGRNVGRSFLGAGHRVATKRGLRFQPTPFLEWMRGTARWFLEAYRGGGDLEGYGRRAMEVEAARRWLRKGDDLATTDRS
jgi:hypothetical protein